MSKTPVTDLIAKLSPQSVPPEVLQAARAFEITVTTNRVAEAVKREQWRLKKKKQRERKGGGEAECPRGQESAYIYSKSSNTQNLTKKESKKESIGQNATKGDKPDWPKDYREQFWAVVPRKVAKADAMRALDKVRKSGTVTWAALMQGAHRWRAEAARTETRFVKHPATWLNKGCWDDEPAPPSGPRGGERRNNGNAFARLLADEMLGDKNQGEDHAEDWNGVHAG